MVPWKDWLLPASLATAQLAWWPGLALARGAPVPPGDAAVVGVLVVVVAGVLAWRRRRPVAVTAVVSAGITAGTLAVPGQVLLVPGDAMLGIAFADMVALFSVAVLCSRRVTGLVLAAVVLWQAVLLAVESGVGASYPLDLFLSGSVYVFVAASGRIRRRWSADRAAAARRLAEAEEARREAAAAERRRLARELHDVTAHHLTSIVVNASAAELLGEQRPELRTEALEFAARTGRETLAALRRLVAILPFGMESPAAAVPSLADLADDFRQLGQVVTVEAAGDPPPELAEAVHGIAREALTNTLRYAPGGTVRLVFSYGRSGAELVVADAGGGGQATAGLGGGRGVTGMRERAQALGGTLTAGPLPDGGWQVRAEFPPAPAARVRARRLGRWLRSQVVLDAGLVLLTLFVPLAGLAVEVDGRTLGPLASVLVLLAVLAHSVPLLWRRQRPWAAFAAVTVTTWLGPLLILTDVAAGDSGWLFLPCVAADFAVVYAVAARVWSGRSWIAPVVSVVSTALAIGVMSVDGAPAGEFDGPVLTMVLAFTLALIAGLLFVPPFGLTWVAGYAAQARRRRRLDLEEGAVAYAAAQAEARAREERARVAAGLRQAVLAHAARVPQAAEDADLTAVVGSAREALSAMRALLDGLNDRHTAEEVPSSSSV